MDAAADYKRRLQDLPPKGGYAPIQTERIKLRTVMGGKIFIYLLLTQFVNLFIY